MIPCLVCQYEAETTPPEQAVFYRVQPATHKGVSLIFEGEIAVCEKHKLYITDEFPESLRKIE